MEKNKNGFTLVELLAVIVILAIILVIAVPKVMDIITDAKKGTLESTAKMIASQAEKAKVQNTILGKDDAITCDSVAKLNDVDYASCSITFNNKDEAQVTITGKGKFNGLSVCSGTKTTASVIVGNECPLICSEQESLIELINPTIPYVVKDYESCVNYTAAVFVNLMEYPFDDLKSLCSGETIWDTYTMNEYINEIIENYGFTKKELIENNVIEGSIEEEKICVPNYSDNAVTYINNLYNDSNIRSKFGLIKDNTADQNIRYVGQYPQNYVEFGNAGELWRIIGIFEVETAAGDTEELVKIVRDESFTDSEGNLLQMSWDSSANGTNGGIGINEWSQADLKTMLNTYYLGESASCTYCNGSKQITCSNDCSNTVTPINSTYRNMVESVIWNTGAIEYSDTLSPLQAYNEERVDTIGSNGEGTGKICSAAESDGSANVYCNDKVERTIEWEGKIGLIYPSDFGYAGTKCTYITNSMCGIENWLRPKTYIFRWVMSPFVDLNSSVYVSTLGFGGNAYRDVASSPKEVLPSIYLKSNVQIIDGDGSKNNPYKLK